MMEFILGLVQHGNVSDVKQVTDGKALRLVICIDPSLLNTIHREASRVRRHPLLIHDDEEETLQRLLNDEEFEERRSKGTRGKEEIPVGLLTQRKYHAFNQEKPSRKNKGVTRQRHRSNAQNRQLYGTPVKRLK